MNFSVDDGLLLANGHQVFPPPPPTTINAVQRRESDGEESDPIPLGYALEIMPLPTPPEEEVELLEIRFTILDLDSHPVPLDTVAISLIHDRDGSIYMAKTDVEETAPNRVSWKQCRGKPSCLRKLLFDRMRDLFAAAKTRMLGMKSRLAGPKGCHGRPPFLVLCTTVLTTTTATVPGLKVVLCTPVTISVRRPRRTCTTSTTVA